MTLRVLLIITRKTKANEFPKWKLRKSRDFKLRAARKFNSNCLP